MKFDRVRFINEKAHEDEPECYPPVGTVGKVIKELENCYYVDWGKDSGTEGNNCWYCHYDDIQPVYDIKANETDEKDNHPVWKMLEPKMTKNGFNPADYPFGIYYYSDDVHKMVELAYTCGYRRAKKGKPFEYSKKNKNETEEAE